jgi:hypothetical protein
VRSRVFSMGSLLSMVANMHGLQLTHACKLDANLMPFFLVGMRSKLPKSRSCSRARWPLTSRWWWYLPRVMSQQSFLATVLQLQQPPPPAPPCSPSPPRPLVAPNAPHRASASKLTTATSAIVTSLSGWVVCPFHIRFIYPWISPVSRSFERDVIWVVVLCCRREACEDLF